MKRVVGNYPFLFEEIALIAFAEMREIKVGENDELR